MPFKRIKLLILVAILGVLALMLFISPSMSATGGWRTQQGNKNIPVVETPPIPGVPYGKDASTVSGDNSLPPEVKEIDEAIRRDAEILQRSLHGGVSGGTQEGKGVATSSDGNSGAGAGIVGQSLGAQGSLNVPGGGPKEAGVTTPGFGAQGLASSSAEGANQSFSGDTGREGPKTDSVRSGVYTGDKVTNLKKADTHQVKGGGSSSSDGKGGTSSIGLKSSTDGELSHKSQTFLWKAGVILAVISILVIVGKRYVFGGR